MSGSKEVTAKSFILKGGAKPHSSVPVWAVPSRLLLGMWLSFPRKGAGVLRAYKVLDC